MALYEKKWWKDLFNKEKEKKVDVLKDINAISEFLAEMNHDSKKLLEQLKKLGELEQEYHVAKSGIIQINLETQENIIDQILKRYEFFQNDVDINGLRVKMIAQEFLKRADSAGLKDLIDEKKKSRSWKLFW
jgi:hypothetical protein